MIYSHKKGDNFRRAAANQPRWRRNPSAQLRAVWGAAQRRRQPAGEIRLH